MMRKSGVPHAILAHDTSRSLGIYAIEHCRWGFKKKERKTYLKSDSLFNKTSRIHSKICMNYCHDRDVQSLL